MSGEQGSVNPASSTPADSDQELNAITVIVAALKPLKEAERSSVLEYVLRRFGAVPIPPQLTTHHTSVVGTPPSGSYAETGAIQDIRTLRENKTPKSANEMAALVAYYVSELAPAAERKPEINKTDIERYFKNAVFKLTANAGQTLVNAKNAGYLDAGSASGYYKLNPVGYNLVVHRLASGDVKKHERGRSHKNKGKNRKATRRKKQ